MVDYIITISDCRDFQGRNRKKSEEIEVIDTYRVNFECSRSYTCNIQAIRTGPVSDLPGTSVRNHSKSTRIEFFFLK